MTAPYQLTIPEASFEDHARTQALAAADASPQTDMGQRGRGPWAYRELQEPILTEELTRLANPRSPHRLVDSITFQPSETLESSSDDRVVTEQWSLSNGLWLFNAVFDGHLNDYTVDHVVESLPLAIKSALQECLSARMLNPEAVPHIIRDSIAHIDNGIQKAFRNIFPPDFGDLTDEDIKHLLHDNPANYEAACRCLGGTTVVLSLTDPPMENCWVATLGDSMAVISSTRTPGAEIINEVHDGSNPTEVQRISSEHPGESCVRDGRILGFLEPTRAIGDAWLKIPAIYSTRVFSNLDQPWITSARAIQYAKYIQTPPYVSNVAEVRHLPVEGLSLVILCSDGLSDLYDTLDQETLDRWVGIAAKTAEHENAALALLRDAIGGEDTDLVSQNLTVDMDEKWIDDTSIVVQRFN